MAENNSYFEDRGIKVSISSSEVIKVVNDKVALAKFFSKCGGVGFCVVDEVPRP